MSEPTIPARDVASSALLCDVGRAAKQEIEYARDMNARFRRGLEANSKLCAQRRLREAASSQSDPSSATGSAGPAPQAGEARAPSLFAAARGSEIQALETKPPEAQTL